MPHRPNILFIVCDQMIAELAGVYGHPIVQTPNLNRLAGAGVRFDNAYTPFPLCAPARACFMSGRHASHIGAWDNGAPLAPDQPTFAHYLAAAGYDTVLSGKMHFVGPDQLHGFRMRLTTDVYSSDFTWVKDEWIRLKETKGNDFDAVMANRPRYNAVGYTGEAVKVDVWSNLLAYDEETHYRAIEYLRARGRTDLDNPFLLCVSYHHPHDPYLPPQEFWDLYADTDIPIPEYPDDLEASRSQMDRNLNAYHGVHRYDLKDPDSLRRVHRAYYALTTYIDHKVGELMRTLDRSGLADNTVIVFCSDHGDMLCSREMVQKRCFYEWSCRVPLLIRFPDRWKAGTACDTPVSLIDLLPTFCQLAETEPSMPVDGDSLIPVIEGSSDRTHIFAQAHEAVGMPCLMMREGRYKYTYIHGFEDQLFDLESDPKEWDNLVHAPEHASLAESMRTRILDTFDPATMHEENLTSLRRRKLIAGVMTDQNHTWCHFPEFDYRKGASDQYL